MREGVFLSATISAVLLIALLSSGLSLPYVALLTLLWLTPFAGRILELRKKSSETAVGDLEESDVNLDGEAPVQPPPEHIVDTSTVKQYQHRTSGVPADEGEPTMASGGDDVGELPAATPVDLPHAPPNSTGGGDLGESNVNLEGEVPVQPPTPEHSINVLKAVTHLQHRTSGIPADEAEPTIASGDDDVGELPAATPVDLPHAPPNSTGGEGMHPPVRLMK